MSKMTQEEFNTTIKNFVQDGIASAVTPILDEQKKQLESVQESVQQKIEEVLSEVKAVRIEATDLETQDQKGGFKSFSHFCRDVARSEKGNFTPELTKWKETASKVEKAAGSGMMETDQEFGGYLIPTEFRNTLLQVVEVSNDLLPRCTKIPMGAPYVEIPYVNGFDLSGGLVFGGIQWLWTDELGVFTEKRGKIGKVAMKLKKLTGLAYVSDEILADSPQSMEGFLKQGFEQGLNFIYNNVIIRGTGAGQPLGLLNANCLVSVAKEDSQAAATILFENVLKMYARVYNPMGCIWIANPNTLPQLATMHLAIGTAGVPVWMPANGITGKPYSTLFGLPLFFNDQCSTLGTVGDLILVDLSQYLIGRKAGSDISPFDTSIHLKFDYGQTAFRFQIRMDGAPWWPTYYTPPQATSDTRSPIVVLATRS